LKIWIRVLAGAFVGLVIGAAVGSAILWHDGYRMYAVQTGSMSPHYPPGDAVIVRPVSSVRVGEVITFQPKPGFTVTHRVQAVTAEGIVTKGDANRTPDLWHLKPNQVVGRAIVHIPMGGFVMFFFRQPTGSVGAVMFLLGIICAWHLFFGERPQPSDAKIGHGRHRRRVGAEVTA
jgi:signal peptidase